MFNMVCQHGMSCNTRHKIGCNHCDNCNDVIINLNGITIKCSNCSHSYGFHSKELLEMIFINDEPYVNRFNYTFKYICKYCKVLTESKLPSCFERKSYLWSIEEIKQERKLQKEKEIQEAILKANKESNIVKSEKYDCPFCKKEVNGISKIKRWSGGSIHIIIHCADCDKFLCYPNSKPVHNYLTNDYFKIDFGKYEGKTITEIVNENREYAEWFIKTPYKSKRKTEDDREKDECNMNALKLRFQKALSLLDESNKLLYQTLYKNL